MGVTNRGLKHLTQLQRLESFGASGLRLTDGSLEIVGQLKSLVRLNLEGLGERSHVSSSGIRALAELPRLRTLRLNSLHCLPITDDDLRLLCRKLPLLEDLRLHGNKISDKGLASLPKLKNLQRLDLTAKRISASGLEALARIPRLRQLDLTTRTFVREGVGHLSGLPQGSVNLTATVGEFPAALLPLPAAVGIYGSSGLDCECGSP